MKIAILIVLVSLALAQQTCTDELYTEHLKNISKNASTDAQEWANRKARFC